MTHSPSQSWSKETKKSSRFEESVVDSTNDQNPAKMPEMWIASTNPGRRSTVMDLASATPLNKSKFCGEQTIVTTSSLNTMGTKRKYKSADDDRMRTSENGNELQTARPTRAGVSNEVAQEFQVISNGNANIEGPQVNFQNEISDPDECAKAANVTLPDRSCMGDPTYELDRLQHYVSERGSTWKQKVYELGKCMDDLLQLIRLCPLRDTEHSMLTQGHTIEQNMRTVEDGHNTADDGETHNENRREIQMQQHSKLINLLETEHILQIRQKRPSVSREDTKNNTAQLFTKHHDGLRTRALAKKLGLRFLDMADGCTNGNDR